MLVSIVSLQSDVCFEIQNIKLTTVANTGRRSQCQDLTDGLVPAPLWCRRTGSPHTKCCSASAASPGHSDYPEKNIYTYIVKKKKKKRTQAQAENNWWLISVATEAMIRYQILFRINRGGYFLLL